MNWRKSMFKASPWLTTISFFLIWEILCRLLKVPPFVLPAPSQAVAALIEFWPGIWLNASHTLLTTLLGFGIAVIFGVRARRRGRGVTSSLWRPQSSSHWI